MHFVQILTHILFFILIFTRITIDVKKKYINKYKRKNHFNVKRSKNLIKNSNVVSSSQQPNNNSQLFFNHL